MANAYGWAKTEILETVYLDEAWEYMKLIKRRQLSDYKIMIAIYHNKPKEMFDLIEQEEKMMFNDIVIESEVLDKTAFEALKLAMSNNPHIIVK